MLLKIKDVEKSYSGRKALQPMSLAFEECGVVGLIGPNGAGKSTLMKIITGYMAPDDGVVEVLGTRVQVDEVSSKRHIGYLPEHNPLYLEMYVMEYLLFAARMYGVARKDCVGAARHAVGATGLESVAGKKIGELSKGYRQRVGIAAAIIHKPKVLILDEPTTGLDPNQLVEIRDLISALGRAHLVIFSTHIMQEVSQLCDTLVVLSNGRIVEKGKKDMLMLKYGSIDDLFYQTTH